MKVGAGSVRAGCASGGGGDVSASGAPSAVEQWIAMIRKYTLQTEGASVAAESVSVGGGRVEGERARDGCANVIVAATVTVTKSSNLKD